MRPKHEIERDIRAKLDDSLRFNEPVELTAEEARVLAAWINKND